MDRFYAKPMRGLSYENFAQWLNAQGDGTETLIKKRLVCEGRSIADVIEITAAQVEALHRSEYQQMVNVFREDTSGHVSVYRYFPAWR